MKLFRFGPIGSETPGVLVGGERVDASGFGSDWNEAFFGGDGLSRLAAWVRAEAARAPRVPAGVRLGPPVARPSKLVCIGLNYRDHARETGAAIPTEPVIFLKATSALAGPDDDVPLPAGSEKLDHEVELALVIGRRAKSVTREAAPQHVAGFVLHNDYSERAFQKERGGQWTKGKGCDGFAPLGPFLATPDECPQVGAAPIWLNVNGGPRQKGSTGDMIFDVPTLVSYVSQFMTLLPGDVLSTGTPAGVGMGRQPPLYLRGGDLVEYGIEGLGTARHRIA
ncbi:MAG TPA: fumarylacetoacetate hydrolase family protein [Polyangia bacterium]|nr:fumarylacetoacetate hydrolase family protein [Polyangia bacterium]